MGKRRSCHYRVAAGSDLDGRGRHQRTEDWLTAGWTSTKQESRSVLQKFQIGLVNRWCQPTHEPRRCRQSSHDDDSQELIDFRPKFDFLSEQDTFEYGQKRAQIFIAPILSTAS